MQPDLFTSSPINIDKMKGQCKRLYEYLLSGKSINYMSPAMRNLKIGYLNSRISDLRNKNNVPIQDKFIEIECDGTKTIVKSYFIYSMANNKFSNIIK